ncbi:MAG: M15 family metallopeptidase [Tunicatimonas sp.]
MIKLATFIILLFVMGCRGTAEKSATIGTDTLSTSTVTEPQEAKTVSLLAQSLIDRGLVNVQDVDSTIIVDLRYSTTNNFVGIDVYGDFDEAYLQAEPARRLVLANTYLRERHPGYALYIYDAVRPRRVQQILWDTLDYPLNEKPKYVADPQKGSIHNYGAAVDLTVAGADGQPLDMGTDFDYFGVLAYPTKEADMLAAGQLTAEQLANRKLLRDVMTRAGFSPITTEWWHFNAFSRREADRRYGIVE